MSQKSTNSKASQPLSDQLERELAGRAYRKVVAGEKLTAQERSALRRYEKQQEEERRWQYYESIPQKHWREMSGRQTKVLHEQAERYGIPFGEKKINLPAVVRALHNFLAENHRRLADNDELMNPAVASPALERYREERALMARLDRLERENTLIDRVQMHNALIRIAAIIRAAGSSLQRQFGPEAAGILNEALDDAERGIDKLFAAQDDSQS